MALVDVRPDDEFFGNDTMGGAHAPGHIAGARQLTWNSLVAADGRFLPRDELRRRLDAVGATPGRPVVAYCMVGMRASVVYFVSRLLGHDARLYDGSIVDWSRRRLPTVTTKL
jgi:thiosulfate/3-mercaptopyruvate sulfurtransferase